MLSAAESAVCGRSRMSSLVGAAGDLVPRIFRMVPPRGSPGVLGGGSIGSRDLSAGFVSATDPAVQRRSAGVVRALYSDGAPALVGRSVAPAAVAESGSATEARRLGRSGWQAQCAAARGVVDSRDHGVASGRAVGSGEVDEREWQRDGREADTRVGLLTPAGDLGPEAEFTAMSPTTVTVHAARVPFAAMRHRGAMDPTIALEAVRAMAEPPGVDSAVELLALAPLDVIGYGFTSSSYVIGRDDELQMCGRLSDRAGGLAIVASGAAMVDAAVSLGAQRVFVVSPPWFDEQLTQLGSHYFASAGLEVVGAASVDLPSDQRSIAPAPLHAWVMANAPVEADVVIIGGNGFRAVGVIEALESDLGRPVVTANQALLWACLKQTGSAARVVGYGQLFS